ncbi:unnamed protein product [Blepharisma stoltei]|uniref:RING-type domain-containing protein n=1 Tax=Blepharisma stoltei TaxID=1481888 RepID=A0AAU9JG57_9CILI|nr:unnamed protein product [Blepharisma stoltei]
MENIVDCNENCFLCEKKQAWKVNFAQFHGLCDYHKESIEESQNYQCIHCESIIFICKFTSVQCDYCYENPNSHILDCNHKICEMCFNEEHSCCPLCKYLSSQSESKETLNENALKEPVKVKINGIENGEDNYESSDSEVIEEEEVDEELYVIEEVEMSLEQSVAFDIRKSFQSTSADSQSQAINSIKALPSIIPEQTFIYKKCPKCSNGILIESETYKDIYKCCSCDKYFCISCLERLKSPKSHHNCTGSTKKMIHLTRKKFNKDNKKLKKLGSMLQVCPFCKKMREYKIEKGYYICCEGSNQCGIMFCLSCGAPISEKDGEAFAKHFTNGSNNPCVDFEIVKKDQNPVIYEHDNLKILKL